MVGTLGRLGSDSLFECPAKVIVLWQEDRSAEAESNGNHEPAGRLDVEGTEADSNGNGAQHTAHAEAREARGRPQEPAVPAYEIRQVEEPPGLQLVVQLPGLSP
eukprot:scaffold330165_cov39-Prasinocladus_malaysianus.AAC.3